MTYELSFGFGEYWWNYLSWAFGYIEITEKGEILVYYPRLYYCPRCGTNAPLGERFSAYESIFDPDMLEVKCDTCWDRPIVDRIEKKRKS